MQLGKFLKNIKLADQYKAVQGGFFLKFNKNARKILIHSQDVINVQWESIHKNNKSANQNKVVQV